MSRSTQSAPIFLFPQKGLLGIQFSGTINSIGKSYLARLKIYLRAIANSFRISANLFKNVLTLRKFYEKEQASFKMLFDH